MERGRRAYRRKQTVHRSISWPPRSWSRESSSPWVVNSEGWGGYLQHLLQRQILSSFRSCPACGSTSDPAYLVLGAAVFATLCWRPRARWLVLCSSRSASWRPHTRNIFQVSFWPDRLRHPRAQPDDAHPDRVPGHGRALILTYSRMWPRCCRCAGLTPCTLPALRGPPAGLVPRADTVHDHRAAGDLQVSRLP